MLRRHYLALIAFFSIGFAAGHTRSCFPSEPAAPILGQQRPEVMPPPPPVDSPQLREELAREMLGLTNAKGQIEKAFAQVTQNYVKDLAPDQESYMQKVVDDQYDWLKLEEKFLGIYVEVFTADDLQRINDFYRTDLGQALLSKQPVLIEKIMQVVQEIHSQNLPRIAEELQKITLSPEGQEADNEKPSIGSY